MDLRDLERRIEALPEAAQREVEALVNRLERTSVESLSTEASQDVSEHPFAGMWADRGDVSDSVAWVRSVRERQWRASHE